MLSSIPKIVLAITLCVIAASVLVRFHRLDNVPGITGDEAVIAITIMDFADGRSSRLSTATGNLFNPLHHGLALLVHQFADPGPFVVRISSLVNGLGCVLAAWLLLPRVLGPRRGLIAALLITTLPTHLAYSRIALSPSLTPLIILVSLYFALRLDGLKTLIACLVAIWVHPTNLFVVPILAAPFIEDRLGAGSDDEAENPRRSRLQWFLRATAAAAAVAVSLLLVNPVSKEVKSDLVQTALARAMDPWGALQFLGHYGSVLSGSSVFIHYAGTDESFGVRAALFWLIFASVMILGFIQLRRRGERRWLAMLAGLVASIGALYLVAGAHSISPHYERWGLFLSVPSCILFAVYLDSLGGIADNRALPLFAGLALAILGLVTFEISHIGGMYTADQQHRGVQTGEVDPKLSALAMIAEMRATSAPAVIMCEDWWVYWPIRYFARNDPDYVPRLPDPMMYPDYGELVRAGKPLPNDYELFYVTFAGSGLDEQVQEHPNVSTRREVLGYSGDPVLRIYRLE